MHTHTLRGTSVSGLVTTDSFRFGGGLLMGVLITEITGGEAANPTFDLYVERYVEYATGDGVEDSVPDSVAVERTHPASDWGVTLGTFYDADGYFVGPGNVTAVLNLGESPDGLIYEVRLYFAAEREIRAPYAVVTADDGGAASGSIPVDVIGYLMQVALVNPTSDGAETDPVMSLSLAAPRDVNLLMLLGTNIGASGPYEGNIWDTVVPGSLDFELTALTPGATYWVFVHIWA